HSRRVTGVSRAQRARELVVPRGLARTALLLEAAAEPVVGVVVDRRELEHGAELRLGGVPAPDPEVRDRKGLADRRLVRLALLRLLERHGGLCGHALGEPVAPLLKKCVDVAHSSPRRYGKFSCTKSTGNVKSRVGPTGAART